MNNMYNKILNPFILDITFYPYFRNKEFTISTSEMNTIHAVVPSELHAEVCVPKANTIYTISCDGFQKTISTENYFGYYYTSFLPELSMASWDKINTLSETGEAENLWHIGNEKNITLPTGEILTTQIYDFNHDDLTSGDKVGITFGLKYVMKKPYRFNTNSTTSADHIYTSSSIYSYLQSDILDLLPLDLTSNMKLVNKTTVNIIYTQSNSYSMTESTDSTKIFLFSEAECFTSDTGYTFSSEGTVYKIFENYNFRKKPMDSFPSNAPAWMFRSGSKGNRGYIRIMQYNGTSANAQQTGSYGINFGFCI